MSEKNESTMSDTNECNFKQIFDILSEVRLTLDPFLCLKFITSHANFFNFRPSSLKLIPKQVSL